MILSFLPRAVRVVAPFVILASLAACFFGGCDHVVCVRAYRCVDKCGGTVVQEGCDLCPAGTIDDWNCPEDGGVDGD